MTSVRIGFPIVFDVDKVAAVWVSTRDKASGKVFWNNVPLNVITPFGDSRLSRASLEIARSRELHFLCSSGYDRLDRVDEGATVQIDGNSFGLALELARHAMLPWLDGADLSVLLSGRLSQDTGYPMSLNDAAATEMKARFAVDYGFPLLLHPDDYNHGCTTLPDYAGDSVPSSDAMTSLRSPMVYRIPIVSGDRWRSSKKPWWAKLGTSLGLTLLHSDEPVVTTVVTPPTISKTQVGSLFEAALPSRIDFRARFLLQNADACARELFEIGSEALKQRDEIFGEQAGPMVTRHVVMSGPTGCGKTSLAEALMLNAVLELDQKVIYVSPTRSLANERHRELVTKFAFHEPGQPEGKVLSDISESHIVLSTGEETATDWRITDGDFKIAVMVNEKANLFLRPQRNVLGRLGLVIFDELHMLAEPVRGGVLDMMIGKLNSENQRRLQRGQGGYTPLRIVAITTEAVLLKRAADAFYVEDVVRRRQGPVVITATRRPLPVTHSARTYGAGWAAADGVVVTHVASDADRLLSKARVREVVGQLRSQIAELSQERAFRAGTPGDATVSPIDMIAAHTALQSPFRTVLVAHPSIPGLRELASQLANRRNSYSFAAPRSFNELLERGAAPASMVPTLSKLANKGIYLHHSELRRELREWTETFFRDIRGRESSYLPPYVLFATETLFYGVNLCVDCVVLTTHAWTRESRSEAGVEAAALTATEFHNVLGRAGRKGAEGITPVSAAAVVGISDQSMGAVGDSVQSLILRYYTDTALNPLASTDVSALFGSDDLATPPLTLGRAAFSSFRSVLDALRHQNDATHERRYAFAADVTALIDKTVFARTTSYNRDAWERVVTTILELAASAKHKLVSKSEADNKYLISSKAEALIDTGTPWESVAPMQQWLSLIKDLAPDQELPVDILVPGFICTSGIWISARTLCWESRQKYVVGTEVASNDVEAETLLRQQLLTLLGESTLVDQVVSKLSDLVELLSASLVVNVEQYRRAIFFRLVTAFLRWLDGADEDEIAVLSLRHPTEAGEKLRERIASEARQWREMYGDRASWLAMMCRRFFEKSGDLRREHLRELPRLSQRLRAGVKALGIPFCSDSRQPGLRRQVRLLLDNGFTPGEVLRDRDPSSRLSPVVSGMSPETIVDGVYRFYLNQTDTLKSSMLSAFPEASNSWSVGRETIDALLVKRRETGGALAVPLATDVTRFRDALKEMLSLCPELEALPQTDGASLRVRTRSAAVGRSDVVLSVIGFGERAARKSDVNIYLPWPDALQVGTGLTAIGGMTLAYLLARAFVGLPRIRDWSKSAARFSSIRDLLDVLTLDMPDLPSELRESMLQFNEPGAD